MADAQPAEQGAYERRIRLASEAATWGIAGILVASAALPTTDPTSRVGLLLSALLLAIFAVAWFRVIPERVFGGLRFAIGTGITQVIGSVLLVLTGGSDSGYFVFFLFPTLATIFAMRLSATVITGAVAVIAYVTILVGDGVLRVDTHIIEGGVIRLSALLALVAMLALIARTMEDTRAILRQRTAELAEQNVELSISRSTTLALARARDLSEILRAVRDAARTAVGADRVIVLIGGDGVTAGFTEGADGRSEPLDADPHALDSPRQAAIRERRTVAINDLAREPAISEGLRVRYALGSALFVPLTHRSDLVGVIVLARTAPHDWTAMEVRLGEVIAEASAPAVASYLALEAVREASERLAERMKIIEGINQLVEALALAPNEESTAQAAARSVAQGFRLLAATVLFVDPSVALLEPAGTAGPATPHPVVHGPANCPALRSGRLFRVASATEPVMCPFVPFREGSGGYACMPLVAGSEPMGALFMEPTEGSILEDAFLRAAADRVALSIANRRVLETAQRQATTDGLTGLHNRHFLQEQLRVLHSMAARHGQSYAAVAMDIDGLKQLNDTFGHEQGDLALRGFSNTLRRTVRGSDIGIRTGGDEFLVLVPGGGLDEARMLAERLREAVAAQGRLEPHTAVTVSLGVAAWRSDRTAEQVLEAADAMLYAAKRAGKDRVMVEAPAPSRS